MNGGEGEENQTPLLHYVMLDQFGDPTESSIANMIHRGAAKTTIFGEYLKLPPATLPELENNPTFPEFRHRELNLLLSKIQWWSETSRSYREHGVGPDSTDTYIPRLRA